MNKVVHITFHTEYNYDFSVLLSKPYKLLVLHGVQRQPQRSLRSSSLYLLYLTVEQTWTGDVSQ